MDNDVVLTSDLVRMGFSTDEVARMRQRGELVRLRRGAYLRVSESSSKASDPWDLRTPHLHLIDGTVPQLHPRAALSHGSAAALHQLPLFATMVDTVHVTRDRHGGGVIRPTLRVHGSQLRDVDRAVVGGRAVTSLPRTVVDLARTLPYEQAVAVADGGLALDVDRAMLAECLDQAKRWHGAPQARRVVAFADGRSESVGESYSRIVMQQLDLPMPVLQHEIFDQNGYLIGRCDFAWLERRTVGEFDGKVKYGRFRRPEETFEDAVYREKLREDAIRDQGWQLVRWTWAGLREPRLIADRLTRAFARAHR
ncbi:MAG: type IV toxin-antitoxin system AbiEi family antitoxin domain-containing protein [Microlunatus sp.]